jgi:hypothetical protein
MAAALVAKLSPWLGVVVTALLLKPLFALRMLCAKWQRSTRHSTRTWRAAVLGCA